MAFFFGQEQYMPASENKPNAFTMYTIQFLTRVIRETRESLRDWYIIRPYGTTFAFLTCIRPERIRDAELCGSVREFLQDNEPFSNHYSDEVAAENLELHLDLTEGHFEADEAQKQAEACGKE